MLREAIDHIESMEFSVTAGLASGISALRTNIEEDKKVRLLFNLCHNSREVAVFLLGHILLLTLRKFDEKYSNPYDYAVTAYLYILSESRSDLTEPAIAAARRLKNRFWSDQYIEKYLP